MILYIYHLVRVPLCPDKSKTEIAPVVCVVQWIRDFSWETADVKEFAAMVSKAPKDQITLDNPALMLELLCTTLVIKEAELSDAILQVRACE